MLSAIIGAAAGLVVLLVIACFFYRHSRKNRAKCGTAMSDLASAELGMRPPTASAVILPDIDAHVSSSSAPAGNLCVHCGTTNEVSGEVCQHCRKQLHRKDVAGLLFEQVAQHVYELYKYI